MIIIQCNIETFIYVKYFYEIVSGNVGFHHRALSCLAKKKI